MKKHELIQNTLFLSYEPSLIASFKRYALGTDTEVLANLIGRVYREAGVTCVEITDLDYPPIKKATDMIIQTVPGVKPPRGCVGSIHSHPQSDVIGVSQDDIHSAILDKEKVWGVYSWWEPPDGGRRHSRLQWFAPGKIVAVCRKGREK